MGMCYSRSRYLIPISIAGKVFQTNSLQDFGGDVRSLQGSQAVCYVKPFLSVPSNAEPAHPSPVSVRCFCNASEAAILPKHYLFSQSYSLYNRFSLVANFQIQSCTSQISSTPLLNLDSGVKCSGRVRNESSVATRHRPIKPHRKWNLSNV